MSKFFGYKPKPQVKSAVDIFEEKTQIRSTNGILLGTVYIDIQDSEWAVAFAYGVTQHPKIRGPEPVYEIRYSLHPKEKAKAVKTDTRNEMPSTLVAGDLPDVDAFVLWALHAEQENLGVALT